MEKKIELAKPRDFGEIINDTFGFVKLNLKPLLKYFFVFCGFFALATIASTIVVEYRATTLADSYDPNDFDSQTVFGRMLPMLWGYLLLGLFTVMQYVMVSVTVLCFMTLYKEKRGEVPTVEEMWGYIKFYFLRILGSNIILYMLIGLGLVLCLLPGIYLGVVFALVPPIMIMENTSFGYAFNQSFKLIKDNWWVTFGVIVVIDIILYVLNLVVTLPTSILGAGTVIQHLIKGTPGHALSLPIIIISAIMQSFSYFFHMLMVVAVGLCYFNLSESKEGTTLISRIDEFGSTRQDPGPQPEEY